MVADPEIYFDGTAVDRPIRLSNEKVIIKPEPLSHEPKAKLRLGDYAVLTLDCYGTLVDRDTGIVNALMPWLNDVGVTAGRGEILRAFNQAERAKLVTAPGVCYRDLLFEVHDSLADFFQVRADKNVARAFANSIKDWPIYSDVPGALAYLRQHFRLALLANIDRESFEQTSKALGDSFEAVYTAEDIGTYKPSTKSFDYLLARLAKADIAQDKVLHIASSLRLDHVPAKRRGFSTCWIHRPHGLSRMTGSVTKGIEIHPDFYFESLGALTHAHAGKIRSS